MKLGDSFFLRSTEYTSQILITPGSFIVTSCLHFAVTFAEDAASDSLLSWNKKKQHESVLCFWVCSVYCTLKIPLCCVDTRPDVFTWHLEMLATGDGTAHGEEQPVDCEDSQLRRTRLEVSESQARRRNDLTLVEFTTVLQISFDRRGVFLLGVSHPNID